MSKKVEKKGDVLEITTTEETVITRTKQELEAVKANLEKDLLEINDLLALLEVPEEPPEE